MKIIKHGKAAPEVMRGDCGHCGTEIECGPTEARQVMQEGRVVRWVTCPPCSRNIYVLPVSPSESP